MSVPASDRRRSATAAPFLFALRRLQARAQIALLRTLLLAAFCAIPAVIQAQPAQPEGASGHVEKSGWATRKFAVAAAHPLAVDAGYQMLKAGGSALDAAIAVQMVLALVEPQSSGIGGGAFLLHWDGLAVEAYDGRETAPAAVAGELFLGTGGKPMRFLDAVVGGRSVGAPGMVSMLETAHRQHGKLPWARLFEPAILLAEQGFPLGPRLHALLSNEIHLQQDPVARSYFFDAAGKPWPAGHLLRNPELASVLKKIASEGAAALLQGEVARDIVAKVRLHPTNPGLLSLQDLAGYRPKKRPPLCRDWRSFRVCGFPPPSSGGLAVAQILGLLQHVAEVPQPLENGKPGVAMLHQYSEAARLAFADRNQYVADPDFVAAPGGNWLSLLDDAYLKQRAGLIGERSMKSAQPGLPGPMLVSWAPQAEQIEHGTSHISVVDAAGHALAMTTSIEDGFGARLMVRGFLLNNQLTDFSFAATDAAGKPIANRVEAGKRPRSSMSPTLVFDRVSGKLLMTLGSPGGALIIHYTAKTLLGTLAWGLDAQAAINLPNFGSLNGPTLLEQGGFPATTIEALKARGHEVQEMPMASGLHAIQRVPGGYFGGADPRREGIVKGE
ncbi:MAG: gamma-glutamyltransferase family protein [Betaproteobacteria bacterium]|nr:gamma-glutamyltransferase family protein [Betaproteobacteria bacterium]